MTLKQLETQRQQLQIELDNQKSQPQRNQLGQFATPHQLAVAIAAQSLKLLDANKVSFLDPAIGTGSFYSALELAASQTDITITKASGFELDPHYAKPAIDLWQNSKLDYHLADFTHITPPNKQYNLVICNPPYIRHHHIKQDKKQLQQLAKTHGNMTLSGRAGLHCYFMALAHRWMTPAGIGAWLIPSEFMDVNYGQGVKDYLLNQVSLLHMHRFDANAKQFDDAQVSSVIVWFKNQKPAFDNKARNNVTNKQNQAVRLTFGDLHAPSIDKTITTTALANISKWTQAFENKPQKVANENHKTLDDYFTIKRGIATGDNQFFILSKLKIEQLKLPISQFRPMLPSPKQLKLEVIKCDKNGYPTYTQNPTEQLFVLDSHLTIDEIKNRHPNLYSYLQQGIEQGVSQRYLCRHRKLWYCQENRPTSHFYCSYIGRPAKPDDLQSPKSTKKPFRFIFNQSDAIVSNSYLILYPKKPIAEQIEKDPDMIARLHHMLMQISSDDLLAEARVYGGGMVKLEPKELAKVRCAGVLW